MNPLLNPMVAFKFSVNVHKDTRQKPISVTISPAYTVRDYLLGLVPNDASLARMITDVMTKEIVKAVGIYTGWGSGQVKKRTKGYLNVENVGTSKYFTTPVSLSAFSYEDVEYALENIHQSNEAVNMHEVDWAYHIDPNTYRVGGKAPKIIPKWAPKIRYGATWKNHELEGKHVNCAAFALNYLVNYVKKNYRTRDINSAIKDAYTLQTKLGWGDEVSITELANFVELKKTLRVVVIDGACSTIKQEFRGVDYSFDCNAPKANLLYLYHYQDWSKGIKHFAACENPNNCKGSRIKNYKWCHWCLVSFAVNKGHECKNSEYVANAPSRKCRKCGIIGKHNCPHIQCKSCRKIYSKDVNDHRCKLDIPDKRGEGSIFFGAGSDECGKYYANLVYDIESAFVRTKCSKSVIVAQNIGDDFEYGEGAYENVEYDNYYDKHVANLIIVKDIFSGQEWTFSKEYCIEDFFEFLFDYNDGKNIVWAHNAAGYDTRLLFEKLHKVVHDNSKIHTIMTGSKIMQLKVDKLIFRDTLRHLPGSLKNLGTDFCKDLMVKGDFPFMFNRYENYGYEGAIPGVEYFPINRFKDQKAVDVFLDYHRSWAGRTDWNFQEQLELYCLNDVRMLAHILLEYHKICIGFADMSPLGFVTGPSFVHSFCNNDSFRQLCRDDPPPPVEDADAYDAWALRTAKEKYWAVLKPNEHYFAQRALRGGRTETKTFICSISEEEYAAGKRIGYTDVVSMYPSVQIDKQFPVGVPTIYVNINDFEYLPCGSHPLAVKCDCFGVDRVKARHGDTGCVSFDTSDVQQMISSDDFFGIVCATFIPPKKLLHPYFLNKDEVMNKNIGTLLDKDHKEIIITSIELLEMCKYGYELVDIHAYHKYNKGNYWREPTLLLYLEKMLNSKSAPAEGEREAFVGRWEEKYGKVFGDCIRASWSRWGKNPAKKMVAKITMNSVWGKQAQRAVLPETFVFNLSNNQDEICDYYANCEIEAKRHINTVVLDDNHILATCIENKAMPNLHSQYMPAACFVTAESRSKLYKEIWNLGDRTLYMDTDSVIFKYTIGCEEYMPPEGNMVGEWETDGMIAEHGDIMEFICFAPKTYGLKFRDGYKIVKAKGLCLSKATDKEFNYDIMKNAVEKYLHNGEIVKMNVMQSGIAWDFTRGMKSIMNVKDVMIQPTHFKGVVIDNYIFPFGYAH